MGKLEIAKRLRNGDFVKGFVGDKEVVGRVTFADKIDGIVEIEDNSFELHTLNTDKAYKATKKEYEEFKATNLREVEESEVIEESEVKAVRLFPNLDKYTISDVKTTSGRKSTHIGDQVALLLEGLNLDAVYMVVTNKLNQLEENVTETELRQKYVHLNQGMQRMNLGNKLRAALKRIGVDLAEI